MEESASQRHQGLAAAVVVELTNNEPDLIGGLVRPNKKVWFPGPADYLFWKLKEFLIRKF